MNLTKTSNYTVCYKVLIQKNKKLYSSNYPHKKEIKSKNATLRYMKGRWTYPKIPNSKLFVFETLERAEEFIKNARCCFTCRNEKFVIYACMGIKVTRNTHIAHISYDDFEKFWKSTNKNYYYTSFVPASCCDSVFLWKKVK